MTKETLPTYEEAMNENEIYSGYTAPPLDETNNNLKKYTSEVSPPDHEIIILGDTYLSSRHNIFNLRNGFSNYSGHTIVVLNNEGKEVFSCNDKGNRIAIYDTKNNGLANVYWGFCEYNNMQIFRGKYPSELLGRIQSVYYTLNNNSESKDTITTSFVNKATGENEEIITEYNKLENVFRVYCNKGEPNETMIGKIRNSSLSDLRYYIEVAPRVDYMLLLLIGMAIYKGEYEKEKPQPRRRRRALFYALQ